MAGSTARTTSTIVEVILNALRGFLIGLAELVPGISGGTVALVVGIYERALDAANDILGIFKALVKDRSTVVERLKKLDWMLLVPVGGAMVIAVFSMAGVMSGFVTNHPETSRALFFGMVLMSIFVPLSMAGKDQLKKHRGTWVLVAIAAVLAFIGTGYTSTPHENPSLLTIYIAAAFAVIALVLPGISGSFLLLAIGLYAPIMESVSNREWTVIGVFILGALTGIILFIRVLGYLLHNHRTSTLMIMAGLMLGSLRALWPWQDANATLVAPNTLGDGLTGLGFVILGVLIVAGVLFAEWRASR